MTQVIVFPRGQLSAADRKRMSDAGILAVEAKDPKSVVTVIPGAPLATSDDLAMAALAAVAHSPLDSVAAKFVRALHSRLADRETKEPTNG